VVLAWALSARDTGVVLQGWTAAGGGRLRIDRYIVLRSEPSLSIKQSGDYSAFEVKGLLTTRRTPELDPLASHLEVWGKWSCAIPGLKMKDQLVVTKTTWRRKFDTSKHVRLEIPLTTSERLKSGFPAPIQGCDVELTEVQIMNESDRWWTLAYEAFGDIEMIPTNLTLVVLPDKSFLGRTIASGARISYPVWLLARSAD
jgi:hypothetical protein